MKFKFATVLAIGAALITPAAASASTGADQVGGVCKQGSPPITVSAHTSCGFAGKTMGIYYELVSGRISGGRAKNKREFTFNLTYKGVWYYPLRAKRVGGASTWGGTVTITGPNGIRMSWHGL